MNEEKLSRNMKTIMRLFDKEPNEYRAWVTKNFYQNLQAIFACSSGWCFLFFFLGTEYPVGAILFILGFFFGFTTYFLPDIFEKIRVGVGGVHWDYFDSLGLVQRYEDFCPPQAKHLSFVFSAKMQRLFQRRERLLRQASFQKQLGLDTPNFNLWRFFGLCLENDKNILLYDNSLKENFVPEGEMKNLVFRKRMAMELGASKENCQKEFKSGPRRKM